MGKNIILIFSICIAAGASYRYIQDSQEIQSLRHQVETLHGQLSEQTAKNQNLEKRLHAEDSVLSQTENQEKQGQSALAQKAALEKQNLASLDDRIRALRAELQTATDPRGIETQLKAATFRVAQLENTLRKTQADEKTASKSAAQNVKQLENQKKGDLAAINAQISAMQQAMKQSQAQLVYWQKQTNNPERANRVDLYQRELAAERSQIAGLTNEKQSLQNTPVDGSQINAEQYEAIDASKQQESSLAGELNIARNDLKRLQTQVAGNDRAVSDLKSRLEALEQQYQIGQSQLRETEAALANETKNLDKLHQQEATLPK